MNFGRFDQWINIILNELMTFKTDGESKHEKEIQKLE